MKRWRLAAALVLGGIFLYSGLIKAGAGREFANSLAPFTILPEAWQNPFAVGLMWTETAAGLLVLLPLTRKIGATVILGLCLLFISVLSWALANGIIVDCACFGPEGSPSAAKMIAAIVRDVFLAALALMVIITAPGRFARLAAPCRGMTKGPPDLSSREGYGDQNHH